MSRNSNQHYADLGRYTAAAREFCQAIEDRREAMLDLARILETEGSGTRAEWIDCDALRAQVTAIDNFNHRADRAAAEANAVAHRINEPTIPFNKEY